MPTPAPRSRRRARAVGGLPHLERRDMGTQQIPVFHRRKNIRRRNDTAQPFGPRTGRRNLDLQPAQRCVVHGRHLDRQHAARRHARQQTRQQHLVAVHPVQRGIRVDQIGRLPRLPLEEVGLLEPAVRHRGPRLLQHRRRAIDPHHLGSGNRCFRIAVTLPAPQPRSTTRAGASSGTCASRSSAGRSRSSANRRYCAGSQTAAVRAIPVAYPANMV